MKKTKLSTTILKSVSVRVLVVIIVSSSISYLHLYNTIEKGTRETLQKYVDERGKREDQLFLLAENNHKILKAAVQKKLTEKPTPEDLKRFEHLFRQLPDGTIRNKKELYDGTNSVGVFIPPGVKITDELKHRVIALVDLADSYGRAFRSQFQDTYFITSENIMVLFWPEVPNWTMEMAADFNMLKEEYGWVADKAHNPERTSKWTGAFYDIVGKTWMASIETPIDIDNFSVTIGHDVMLDEFVSRVSSEHLDGTYNIIFRDDGRLIAHPSFLADIKSKGGKLDLQTTKDSFLQNIFKTVVDNQNAINGHGTAVVKHPDEKNILAFTKLKGPKWYFVTVYPDSLIASTALSGISFIILLALASLGFEIAFLYYGLKRDVLAPLHKLEGSVTKISEGEYHSRLDVDRTDELGQLAESFNIMAQKISDNEKSLIQKVDERTKQVDEQRAVLIQKSKLASLGEMAGGIAHEINTPLAIIGMKVEQLSESLEEKSLDDEELKSGLDVIKATNERIAKIISGLRFVARDGSQMATEVVKLNFIIDETCSFCADKMRLKDINFTIIKDYNEDSKISCRAVEISQVILNVLNNAIDAIATRSEKWVELKVKDKDHSFEISITDSGPGISSELVDKIMQPFFTTKEIGKGTGLGLSISRGIIESHSGKFYIDTEADNTRFIIILPKSAV